MKTLMHRTMMRARTVPEIKLIGWGFLLNGIWEFLQSPLYADHDRGTIYILWSRLHCTAGDILILLGAYWITSVMFRTRSWPADRGFPARVVFVGCGFFYTAWSEWFNTRMAGAWTYAPSMPLVFGVGASPLVQWLLVPGALVFLLKRSGRS
jgi:hypothetical protein